MGCTNSKVDELPAVFLCRERCGFLDEAIRERFAFSEAHVAYLHSLKAVGASLDRFFNQDLEERGSSSPVLTLPTQRKGESSPPNSGKIHHLHSHSHSHSDSGSHLHFHSDDEESEDEDGDGSGSEDLHHLHHHDDDEDIASPRVPSNPYGGYFPDYNYGGGGGRYMNVNYMKNQSMPSVVYTQRPMSPETMHMGGESSSSSYYYPYPPSNSSTKFPPYPDYNNYKNYDNNTSNGYPPNDGAFSRGYSSQVDGFSSAPGASTSKAPPPPPSPPSSSTWGFLNPFESFDRFYPAYTPSRYSREVREEEGIPELEDEDENEDDDEVVKEVHGNQEFVESSNYSKPSEEEKVADATGLHYRARPSVGTDADPVEYEVHMVDKKVVDAPGKSKDRASTSGFTSHVVGGGFKGDPDVVREIQLQFERASESGTDLAKFLEVGKLQYKRKHGGQHVSSKMLHLPLVSSQASIFKRSDSADPALDVDQETELRSKNLSSTLHKLHLWEKKLYEEVKVEEKMRILHEQKSKKLKRLDEKGAEAHKVDATRALVSSLSTKIKIAIQVVDKISVKINNLRDEELWPQINEFIQGLASMWKAMLECHQNQCHAIAEAKRLDAIALRKRFSDAHFDATRQLEQDIVNWTLRFSYWVRAQKAYVRSMNSWLMKCLLYVPEETPDGTVPFSPGRIGAPPIFVIFNQWWQSLDRVSEKDVVDSMRELAVNVLQLWDRDKVEIRQRMLANKDDRKIKILDKEEQKMQKEIQALQKRVVQYSADDNGMPLTGHVVYQSETTKGGSLQASLRHVLEAMEKFTANSLKVYEELSLRIEEDHLG